MNKYENFRHDDRGQDFRRSENRTYHHRPDQDHRSDHRKEYDSGPPRNSQNRENNSSNPDRVHSEHRYQGHQNVQNRGRQNDHLQRNFDSQRSQFTNEESKYIFNPSMTTSKPAQNVSATKPLNQACAFDKNYFLIILILIIYFRLKTGFLPHTGYYFNRYIQNKMSIILCDIKISKKRALFQYLKASKGSGYVSTQHRSSSPDAQSVCHVDIDRPKFCH